ncbi:MAG: PilZ domain-containing protein [Candidatus Omnitrophica bacterium]|nr:PilZ domain-containing protein [Candidatus Omnitrophota bacterium]
MEEKKPEERRKYVRFNVQTKVNFQVVPEKKESAPSTRVEGISKNISAEGICFSSEKKLTPGSKLELEIFLPNEPEPLLLMGEVKWSEASGQQQTGKTLYDTGVQLFNIAPNDENRYVKYVVDKMMECLSRYLHL